MPKRTSAGSSTERTRGGERVRRATGPERLRVSAQRQRPSPRLDLLIALRRLGRGTGCHAVALEQAPDLLNHPFVVTPRITILLAPDRHGRTTSFVRIVLGAYARSR